MASLLPATPSSWDGPPAAIENSKNEARPGEIALGRSIIFEERTFDKRKELAESAAKSTTITKKMIEAGLATALDAGLIELEQLKLKNKSQATVLAKDWWISSTLSRS